MATQKQIEANRKNAGASTGPKSAEGKERAKMNRLTHGLRAERVVLPTENEAEFRAFLDAWVDDWKPPTMARLALVEEAATSAWRKRRFVRAEATRVAERLDRARGNARRRQREAAGRLADRIEEEPFEVERALRSTRAGTSTLIGLWRDLADGLTGPRDWDDFDDHHMRLFSLMGRGPGDRDQDEEVRGAFALSWPLYLSNSDDDEPDDGFAPFDEDEADDAVEGLLALMERRIAALTAHWHALPDDSAAIDRSAEAEALEPTKEDMLALRYESQRHREFHRALGDLTKLTRSGDDLVADDAEAAAPNEAKLDSQVESQQELATIPPDDGSAAEPAEAAPGEPARVGAWAGGRDRAPRRAPRGAESGDLRKAS